MRIGALCLPAIVLAGQRQHDGRQQLRAAEPPGQRGAAARRAAARPEKEVEGMREWLQTSLMESTNASPQWMETSLMENTNAEAAVPFGTWRFGIMAAAVSFVTNGCHSAFAKMVGDRTSQVVYLNFVGLGMLAASASYVIMHERPRMSTAGFLSGVVFSQAIFCGLQSIAKIGIAWCDMTAATTAALTAYVAGKVIFQERSKNIYVATAGMVLLLGSIIGLSATVGSRTNETAPADKIKGILYAVAGGLCSVSTFFILKFDTTVGYSFLLAQAAGFMTATIVVLLGAHVVLGPSGLKYAVKFSLPYGLAQGAMLFLANLSTIAAIASPLGIGIATPCRQAGHTLAIFLGAFMFREFGKVEAGLGLALLACALSFVAGIILLVAFGSAT